MLLGANDILAKTAVAIIEVEDHEYWSGQWMQHDVASALYDVGLVPVARDFQSRYQYNQVFVHQSLLSVDRFRWVFADYRSRIFRPS